MPIWIQLSCIPLEFFTQNGLSYIASVTGSPLYMDSITISQNKLSYAKVCIEIAADFVVHVSVNVELNDGSIVTIDVEIPWMSFR
ncbi:hypothetical protein Gotri_024363 [Gossypium trilobum]|uniref:DUF4283 domain-containing protein n=1 Tax=Gossypium trilobum TaxID=34281 RepID=A0A7J9DM76_9ROSI|nr:hypothetical protein [Gossypium trilobum]